MIKYVNGDATKPEGDGTKIIPHIVNDINKWGRGFVLAVSKKWKQPEIAYHEWYKDKGDFALGAVQFIHVENDIYIANMVGQKGIYPEGEKPPIRYDAVRSCLKKVCEFAKEHNASIHAPYFGSGLALGNWLTIEKIINEELINNGIKVTIYDLEK